VQKLGGPSPNAFRKFAKCDKTLLRVCHIGFLKKCAILSLYFFG
jgi:hypothetical protein